MHVLEGRRNGDLLRGRKFHALCHLGQHQSRHGGLILILPSARRSIPSAIVIDGFAAVNDVERPRLRLDAIEKSALAAAGLAQAPLFGSRDFSNQISERLKIWIEQQAKAKSEEDGLIQSL